MVSDLVVSVGIIGSGFMARTYAECLLRYVEGAELRVIAGGSRAPELAREYGVEQLQEVQGVFERGDISAVIIATPETIHPEQGKAAARAGKHVLIEKPLAPTLGQCDAVIAACRDSRVRLMQVKHWRFRRVHRRAIEILRAGDLGAVRQIHNRTLVPVESSVAGVKKKPFYLDPAGGGLFMGWCTHNFDLVRWLVESEARQVYAMVTSFGDHAIPELTTMAQIVFANDSIAQVWVSAELPGPAFSESLFHTQVVCEEGVLDLDGVGGIHVGRGGKWQRIWEQPKFDPQDPLDPQRLEGFAAMVQEFIDAIREDREASVTGADGRAAVELCLAARKSAKLGYAVDLPLGE